MPYLKHSLGKTFYLKKGKSKKGVICLHGGPGGDHRLLKPLLNLATTHTVVLYDQLGGGRNPETKKSKWSVQAFVKELHAIINYFNFDEVTLVGASWGTTLALEYTLKYPEKVDRIVFQSPMFSAKDWQTDAKALIRKMNKKDSAILLRSFRSDLSQSADFQKSMFAYYLKHVLRNKKALEKLFKWGLSPGGLKIYQFMWGNSEFHATGTLKNYNKVSHLKKLNIPVLFICGEYDEATPKRVRGYSKKIKNSKFKVIQGGSHVLSFEKPKELLKAIQSFLL